jgi:chromosome segregation ATPase
MHDTIFDVSIEAGAGTPYSESLTISLLTEYLSAGYIDYETYLELLPAQVATFKTTLMKKVKEGNTAQLKQAQETIQALQEQLAQSNAVIQELAKKIEQQGQTVEKIDQLINRNRSLSKSLADLYNEATAKISEANAIMTAQQAKNAEVMQDASTMAQMMSEDEESNMQEAEKTAKALKDAIGQ